MRRTLTTVAMAFALLGVGAPPAGAHAVSGADSSSFKTRLLDVTPRLDGLEVEVIENGSRIQLTSTRDEPVIVLGYQEEPYLRVGPDGVYENVRSPATYLNEDRHATEAVPAIADPEAEPEWRKVSAGRTARWHDHRIHWMGERDPPAVRRAPDRRHVIYPEWVIRLRAGDTPVTITGDLLWVPGPSPWPWYGLAAGLGVALVALAATRWWRPAIAVAVVAVVAVDVGHVVAIAAGIEGSLGTQLGQLVAGSIVSALGWIAGGAAVALLARRHADAAYVAAFAGAMVGANGGLRDLADLSRSQLVAAGPDALIRVAVAASIGLGLGLVAAALVRYVRTSGPPAPVAPS